MNKADRKTLQTAIDKLVELQQLFEDARDIVRKIADGEQEKFDNMSEGLQQGERGQAIGRAADVLGNVASEMEGTDIADLVSQIEEAMG